MNFNFKNLYKYTILTVCLSCQCLIACKENNYKSKPKDLLQEHQMGQILADILLLQGYADNNIVDDSLLSIAGFQKIIPEAINEKYHLADSQAYYSYQYYVKEPEVFRKIIGIARDTLESLMTVQDTLIQQDSSSNHLRLKR